VHARTTIVEILGQVDVHSWITTDALGEDAYSLFMARSTAMNWADAGPGGSATWGMNDARFGSVLERSLFSEPPTMGAAEDDFVATAQVSVDLSIAMLPVLSVAECIRSTIERVGVLRFEGLRVSSTGWGSVAHRDAASTLTSCLNWFEVVDPGAVRTVRAVVRSAPGGPGIDEGALVDALGRRNTGRFRFEQRGDGLAVTVPEWSVGAAAWAATMLADESGVFHTDGRPSASIEMRSEAPI
jgi:hypothetical protein